MIIFHLKPRQLAGFPLFEYGSGLPTWDQLHNSSCPVYNARVVWFIVNSIRIAIEVCLNAIFYSACGGHLPMDAGRAAQLPTNV